MKIWFYQREVQIGDYVYADRTYSDIYNNTKTVVGICFYIDPKNKNNRLCVGMKNLTASSWGLFSGSWSGGITLADSPGYSVFDVPTLTNKNVSGLATGSTINEASYRDSTSNGDEDGFIIPAPNTALAELGWADVPSDLQNSTEESKLPYGRINTLLIKAHRDKILRDSNINLPIPSKTSDMDELSNLMKLMNEIVERNGNDEKYRQYYYPPASQCYAYEPLTNRDETIAECFKAGQWFLPSAGELARLYWYYAHDKENNSITNGIFGNSVKNGIFSAFGSTFYTSVEYSGTSALLINFDNGYYNAGSSKTLISGVRPVCAF